MDNAINNKIAIYLNLTICLLISGCNKTNEQQRSFTTELIKVSPLVDSVLATGRIETTASVDVSSQQSGLIEEVFVDFNERVSEGQSLAKLDQLRFQSRVEELNAALLMAQADLESAIAAINGATAKLEQDRRDNIRKRKLWKNGSISETEVDEAKSQLIQSESSLKVLLASKNTKIAALAAATASLHQAQIDLDRTVITSPIEGVVINRNIEPGQTVAASLEAPVLFTIANDLSEIEVHAKIDEADIGKVGAGQVVWFSVDAFQGHKFEGRVRQIRKASKISQNVVTYTVVISARNPDELMLPGMTALVEIISAQKENVLQVPNAALRFQMPNTEKNEAQPSLKSNEVIVWLKGTADNYQQRKVVIGYSDDNFTEVLAGELQSGDEVITGYRQ